MTSQQDPRIVEAKLLQSRFALGAPQPVNLPLFGGVHFPFVQMGAVSSADLFTVDEIELFNIYWRGARAGRWHRFLDGGANLGLHSIIAARCRAADRFLEVHAYEPDPDHFSHLVANFDENQTDAEACNSALWVQDDVVKFCQVVGNGTANHIVGTRSSHGSVEVIDVPAVDYRDEFTWADIIKLDVEGAEAALLADTSMTNADFIVEVTGAKNADVIFDHFIMTPMKMYAQRGRWAQVTTRSTMPESWRDGHLFISSVGPPP